MSVEEGKALSADYARAGFGGTLGLGQHPALIIVDVARAYLVPESPLYLTTGEAALAVNITLADAFRAAELPVVFTRVLYQPGGTNGGLFYRRVRALACFDEGNPLGDFDPRLTPFRGDLVITKQYPSAFFGTSLASTLHALRCDTCVVTGFSTSGCVRASALDALCYGFRALVADDASADRDPVVHRQNLFDLDQKYADVVSSALLLDKIAAIRAL
ncbi:isochorismatase family protein [Sphingosinicella microcystinivorans]|uniref:isochorismatase family protein n=1 Tax=Sphingosinicella microcystinivorans TaxID=335406 RepID=UPI0022F3D085|nr:isochorismatase family protein [Sphingosinicella microcystinivorans]WBX85425.1 isochorismatase family protein [Sphingosinicella microcystinivorans]